MAGEIWVTISLKDPQYIIGGYVFGTYLNMRPPPKKREPEEEIRFPSPRGGWHSSRRTDICTRYYILRPLRLLARLLSAVSPRPPTPSFTRRANRPSAKIAARHILKGIECIFMTLRQIDRCRVAQPHTACSSRGLFEDPYRRAVRAPLMA